MPSNPPPCLSLSLLSEVHFLLECVTIDSTHSKEEAKHSSPCMAFYFFIFGHIIAPLSYQLTDNDFWKHLKDYKGTHIHTLHHLPSTNSPRFPESALTNYIIPTTGSNNVSSLPFSYRSPCLQVTTAVLNSLLPHTRSNFPFMEFIKTCSHLPLKAASPSYTHLW
jgi:hypothetical protein